MKADGGRGEGGKGGEGGEEGLIVEQKHKGGKPERSNNVLCMHMKIGPYFSQN